MKPLNVSGTGLSSIPSALMSFRTACGTPRMLAVAWVGVVCSRPAVLSITLRQPLFFPGRWPEEGEFAVNLPNEEQMASRAFLDLLEGGEIRSFAGSGLSLASGAKTGAPVVAECPVRIECCRATLFSRFGQELVSGEVAAVHTGGRIYGLEGPVDLCHLKPFAGALAQARRTGFAGIVPPGLDAGLSRGAPS